MKGRDYGDYLQDIPDSVQEIGEFTKGMDLETFRKDRKTINAVVRSLEVMGEAAKRIPEGIRKKHPAIPWKRMAGARDKLINEYTGVDIEIVWAVVREELPPLIPIVRSALAGL
ncbi:MAG: DUF86 domain-containing protein [Euryarchaeota archaeon]|nr:DUF86 domain-containing protein [Euryarchaeota archaeon]